MTKTANSSIPANKNAKDFPELSAFYREIGIAAVAAAVRYQRMPASDDSFERGKSMCQINQERRLS